MLSLLTNRHKTLPWGKLSVPKKMKMKIPRQRPHKIQNDQKQWNFFCCVHVQTIELYVFFQFESFNYSLIFYLNTKIFCFVNIFSCHPNCHLIIIVVDWFYWDFVSIYVVVEIEIQRNSRIYPYLFLVFTVLKIFLSFWFWPFKNVISDNLVADARTHHIRKR